MILILKEMKRFLMLYFIIFVLMVLILVIFKLDIDIDNIYIKKLILKVLEIFLMFVL